MNYMDYLTDEEQQAIYDDNAAHHWGFDFNTVCGFLMDYAHGTDKEKAEVLCRFEDVNYHTLAACLDEGDWKGVMEDMVLMFGDYYKATEQAA